jgi:hypothetical protein
MRHTVFLILLMTTLVFSAECKRAFSASALAKAMIAMPRDLKQSSSILSDIDKVLQVPPDWIEEAKKDSSQHTNHIGTV